MSATDVHSIQISRDGKTRAGAEPLCSESDGRYPAAFRKLAIDLDAYMRTDEPDHVAMTHRALARLEQSGHLQWRESFQLRCRDCGAVPPARLAQVEEGGAQCPWCRSSDLHEEQAEHLMLDLEPLRELIEDFPAMAQGPGRQVAAILAEPLKPRCVTRDHGVGMAMRGLGAMIRGFSRFRRLKNEVRFKAAGLRARMRASVRDTVCLGSLITFLLAYGRDARGRSNTALDG